MISVRRFKGGTQDRATEWVLFGNRWYNPDIGRWTQQDTLDAPLNPNNANRYAYAGCDPINNSVPTGRCTFLGLVSAIGDGIAVFGALAGGVMLTVAAFVPVSAPIGAGVTVVGGLAGGNITGYTYLFSECL